MWAGCPTPFPLTDERSASPRTFKMNQRLLKESRRAMLNSPDWVCSDLGALGQIQSVLHVDA